MDRKAVHKPRRLGVTPQMLTWLGRRLVEPLEATTPVMLKAAMVTAWFFMLRAKEYCDSNGVDDEMILRGIDIRFTRDTVGVDDETANEVTMQFRKTKSDQLAFGESKTLNETKVVHLCPVKALLGMKKAWPTRFARDHRHARERLFRWANGNVLKRIEVQSLLQQAARGVGLPPERFLSHSLRIGGATALFQSTGEIELVKRQGRWSSSAVQRYLHDGGDQLAKVLVKMAKLGNTTHYA